MEIERKYAVYVVPAVYEKMYAHFSFLAQVSVPAAERLCDTFEEAFNDLKYYPDRYTIYHPQKPTDATLRYKLCAKNRYRVVFETIGSTVYVYDIQDCRQNSDKNLQ